MELLVSYWIQQKNVGVCLSEWVGHKKKTQLIADKKLIPSYEYFVLCKYFNR